MARKKSVAEEVMEAPVVETEEKIEEAPVIEKVEGEIVTEIPVGTAVNLAKGLVNVGMVNVRRRPTIESEIITMFAKDTEVTIDLAESTRDFYRIVSSKGGIIGFIRKDLIQLLA